MSRLLGTRIALAPKSGKPVRLWALATSRLLPDPHFDRRLEALRTAAPGVPVNAARPGWRWLAAAVATVALVVAVALDRPWEWVAGAEAEALPDPCAVALEDIHAIPEVADAAPHAGRNDDADHRICGRVGQHKLYLVVLYTRFPRYGAYSGTAKAIDAGFQYLGFENLELVPDAPHLGDGDRIEYVYRAPGGPQPMGIVVYTRRANVQLSVYYGADQQDPAASGQFVRPEAMIQAVVVAGKVLDAVRFG